MRDITKSASEGGHTGWDEVGGLVNIQNAVQEVRDLFSKAAAAAPVRDALVQVVLRLRDDVLKDREGGRDTPAVDSIYSSGGGVLVHSALQSVPPVTSLGYDQRIDSASAYGLLSSRYNLCGYESFSVYVNYSEKFKNTWEGLSMECFKHVLPSMKLAIPSAVMVCLEYWAFELLVLLAGLMLNSENNTSLIAMCVNTEAVCDSTRVSNELGAGNADRAKNVVSMTLKLSIFLALVVVLSLIFGHNLWARVSRGCGWQHLAAWTNLATFYAIGMPIVILLGFKVGDNGYGSYSSKPYA
ncbi:hypothetical protein IFM89_018431, partial [Coptis chinensis]